MRNAVGYVARSLVIVEAILRERLAYLAGIHRRERLPVTIGSLVLATSAGLAVFGFVMGLSGGSLAQAFGSALKLPCLFLVGGLICLPTLYHFSILFGSRIRFLQVAALILTSQSVSATLAVGFTPIILLFRISRADPAFLVALNAAALGLSTALGLMFLVQGLLYVQEPEPLDRATSWTWVEMFFRGALRSLVLVAWLAVYGLVGAQLAWIMRPLFGVPVNGTNFWSSLSNLIDMLW